MKRLLWAIGLILMVAMPSIVVAQTTESQLQNTGYDNGFFIQNNEKTFKLTMVGRVQPKITFQKESLDDVPNNHYRKRTTFSLRRAEMAFIANVNEKLMFRTGILHSTNSQNFAGVNVYNTVASYEFIPEFVVTAGMVGLPLSMMAEVSSRWLLLPDFPLTELQDDGIQDWTIARASFTVPDGLGINFAGDISKFFYSVSVVNGNESNYAFNPGNKFSFGGRFGVNILDPVPGSQTDFECSSKPKLTMSAGTMYQAKRTDPNTNAVIKYLWTSSLGIALRWGGFAFTTEGYYRKTHVLSSGTAAWWRTNLDDLGWYATAGYYIIPKKFEIAAEAAQIIREGPDNNANQFGGGLNYYAIDNNLKLQLAYVWTMDYDDMWGSSNNNHIHNIALMASALF